MRKIMEILKICGYEFRIQAASWRMWCGYFVGAVIIMRLGSGFYQYAAASGEPINVLEPFIVLYNTPYVLMMLFIGWFLVVSEAPFYNGISMYLVCRTDRRSWNTAMLLYIAVQAFIYQAVMALVMVIAAAENGFLANAWSLPLIALTEDPLEGAEYGFGFCFPELIASLSVVGVFTWTFLLAFLYTWLLGLVMYLVGLFSNRIIGVACAVLFHYIGYEIAEEGMGFTITFSLLARISPANQIGANTGASLIQSLALFLLLILILISITEWVVKYVDFRQGPAREADV